MATRTYGQLLGICVFTHRTIRHAFLWCWAIVTRIMGGSWRYLSGSDYEYRVVVTHEFSPSRHRIIRTHQHTVTKQPPIPRCTRRYPVRYTQHRSTYIIEHFAPHRMQRIFYAKWQKPFQIIINIQINNPERIILLLNTCIVVVCVCASATFYIHFANGLSMVTCVRHTKHTQTHTTPSSIAQITLILQM